MVLLVSENRPKSRILGYVFEAVDMVNKQKVALKRTQKAGDIVSREY